MATETTERSFDELTRGLATGSISRGKALRLMGVALVGSTLASFPGVAWAAKGGRSSCAQFCESLFGENTPDEEDCVSQGTKGLGPCFKCTDVGGCGPNFTKPDCTDVEGQTYSCSTCDCECPSGQVLCNGSCVSNICTPPQTFDTSSCKCCTSNGGTCSTSSDCCSDNCSNGTCACPSGTEPCGGNCLPPCPSGQIRIPNCSCLCPPTSTFCGGNCLPGCPAGQVRDPATCACVPAGCSPPSTLCGGNCLPPCSGGQVRNPTTCVCE